MCKEAARNLPENIFLKEGTAQPQLVLLLHLSQGF